MVQWWASYIYYGENLEMKLSEYLHKKMCSKGKYYLETRTEEQIEEWIVEWYRSEFSEIGCDGSLSEPRMPPMWLAEWNRDDEMESDYDPNHGTCCRNGCEKCEQ